jgi:MFS family permease
MQRSGGMLAALRHRDVRLLMSSAAVSQVGDWLYNVALAVYVYDRTHSSVLIGIITLLRLIPYVLLAPLGGVIADRYERRTVLVVSDVLRAAIMAAVALAVAGGSPVIVVGLLAMATTAAGTAYSPATVAMLPGMLDEDELGAANSLVSLIQSVAIVSGPALGALLLVLATPTWSFVVNAASFALGAVLTARISIRSRPDRNVRGPEHPVREFAAELADGARVVREQPVVRVLTSLVIGSSFVYGTQTVVLVLVASHIGNSTSGVGVFYAALGFGGVIGAPIAARAAREQRLGGIALAALVVGSAPMAVLAVVNTTALAFVLVTISGAGMVVTDVLAITLLQRSVANEVTGRVMGIFDASAIGAIIVGSIVVAPLVNAFSYDTMLVVVALAAPLVVIFQMRSLLHADRDAALTWSQTQLAVRDLQRSSLFASLRESALERIARGIKKERYAVGDTILVEGTIGSACYTVLHGRVDVRRGGEDGEVIATLAENDHFGEIGLLHNVPRTATVTAASDVVLYVIDAETFRAALETDAIVASHAMESAGARLAALTT